MHVHHIKRWPATSEKRVPLHTFRETPWRWRGGAFRTNLERLPNMVKQGPRSGPNRPAAAIGGVDFWYGPFLAASEAAMALEQPRRSDLTWDLKTVTPITYIFMCILLTWYGPLGQTWRPLQSQNSLGGQIWPLIWNQWPQIPTYPCAYYLYGIDNVDSHGGHFKQPQMLDLTSDLKSVTSITYIFMCKLLTWYGPFGQPQRPLWPPNNL